MNWNPLSVVVSVCVVIVVVALTVYVVQHLL